jgi:uncharacterized protein
MRWGEKLLRMLFALFFVLVCSGSNLTTGIMRPLGSICFIQGDGYSSPYQGSFFRVRGYVILDYDQHWRKGFHIQDPGCDASDRTSDGLYVYLDQKVDVVSVGDYVEVSGEVHEYYGLTEILAEPERIIVFSSGNQLPTPIELNPPFDNEAARAYFEARESMLVKLDHGSVVGPTDQDGRTWMVRRDLNIDHVFHSDLAGTGEVICIEDEANYEITPGVRTIDEVKNLVGVLAHRAGLYCVELTAEPQVIRLGAEPKNASQSNLHQQQTPLVSFVTLNLYNLFDNIDDPLTDDSVFSGVEYQRRLNKLGMVIHDELEEPAVISLQEVENLEVLKALADQPHIQSNYIPILVEGPDKRGIDVGFLFREDFVKIQGYQFHQGCTSLMDGLGPDGNLDMDNPHNDLTCDLDGDTVLDGNRLFSRPPLLVKTKLCISGYSDNLTVCNDPEEEPMELILINVHLKSKLQDKSDIEITLPRRLEQAQFLNNLIDEIRLDKSYSNIMLLGDFNDNLNSQTITKIEHNNMSNLANRLSPSESYTYIYHGVSYFFDHIFSQLVPGYLPLEYFTLHINADFPYEMIKDADIIHRSSDHDIFGVRIGKVDDLIYLPVISR